MGFATRSIPLRSASTDSLPPAKVPEAIGFARTIENWQDPTIAAVQTGMTNVRTEGYDRGRRARLAHRLRFPQSRQPTPPPAVGLHSPITRVPPSGTNATANREEARSLEFAFSSQ